MSPDFISTSKMPVSSADPVSVAVQHSINTSRKRFSTEDLDQKVFGTAKRILLTDIQYVETNSFDGSITENLKSKYTVLSDTSSEHSENKIKNGYKESHKELKATLMNKSDVLPKPKKVLYPPELIELGWKDNVPVGAGLFNLGNTCYLNSTLQALFHVPAFVNWLLDDKIHTTKCEILNGINHTECIICAMKKTLNYSHNNSGSVIKPVQIYQKLKLICKRLVHGHQEDAHEFLRYLIESMEKSYLNLIQAHNLDSYSKETTPLNHIFGGYIRTEVTCLECKHVSTTFSHFQDLLVDIGQANSVDDALESYFSRERLGEGSEAYKCDQCHKRVAATKKFSIERPPNVLCVQLKRFEILGGKNCKHVSLSRSLDLTKYCHKDSLIEGQQYHYKLVSLISHIGTSANCGHYTAVGHTSEGRYYHFDDTLVRYISETTLTSTSNAYVIMYEMVPQPTITNKRNATLQSINMNGRENTLEKPANTFQNTASTLKQTVTTIEKTTTTVNKIATTPKKMATTLTKTVTTSTKVTSVKKPVTKKK
uniref:Ubiquitin carboxyl-terminal hydrolase n=1 Tax=Clastoptera arizonana TaxID=38151 RepID=A0A1B6D2S0_9HEMI